jgi:hypothetical protein
MARLRKKHYFILVIKRPFGQRIPEGQNGITFLKTVQLYFKPTAHIGMLQFSKVLDAPEKDMLGLEKLSVN